MTTELQLHHQDRNLANIFFAQTLVATDWDEVYRRVIDGSITSKDMLARLKSYEPLLECDPRDLDHWRDQQRLRLALLHESGKPFHGNAICDTCGRNKIDILYEKSEWSAVCLPCAEREKQVKPDSSRGNCQFLKVAYNPRSRAWGLMYYWSHSSENTFIFWLADFYLKREYAEQALWPISSYFRWLRVKHNGMIAEWLSFSRLLPLEEVMKLKLPLTPEQFRDHLHAAISEDLKQEQTLMSYYVTDAMRDHERAEDDE